MPHQLVPVIGMLSVFGMPTVLMALHLRQRHRERMRALETANNQKVSALEAARSDLEARVRTLETIVTDGDRNLEQRLRQLAAAATPALDGERRQLPERPPR